MPFKKLLIDSHQAVYFEIPKVACTTVNFLLVRLLIKPGEKFTVQQVHSDPTLPRVFGELDSQQTQYFKFAFVRHPLTRLQSCFLDKIKPIGTYEPGLYDDGLYVPFKRYGNLFWPGMSFFDFVAAVAQIGDFDADPHFRSQSCFVADESGTLKVDFVGRFEKLESDLADVLARFNVDSGSLRIPKINKQNHPQDWGLGKQTLATIFNRYRADFERFDYTLESKFACEKF